MSVHPVNNHLRKTLNTLASCAAPNKVLTEVDVYTSEQGVHNALSDCRVSFYGAHISLIKEDRIELVEYLVRHLTVTLDLLEDLKLVEWRLRSVSFSAIQHMFGEMISDTAEYAEHVFARIRDCGGKVDKSLLNFEAPVQFENAPDFSACLTNIRDRIDVIAGFANQVHGYIDQAYAQGDYATSTLITEILSKAEPIIRRVDSQLPRDSQSFT